MENGVLYVSILYGTCVHRCLCGCGEKVVTPLSPNHWAITYDGETVSLAPSVGSRSLPCRSHYIIHSNRVRWFPAFTDEDVAWHRDAPPHTRRSRKPLRR
jgi:hypothetical protein